MTVGELKKILEQYIDDMPIYLVEEGTVKKSMDIRTSMILGADDNGEMEYFLILQTTPKGHKNE